MADYPKYDLHTYVNLDYLPKAHLLQTPKQLDYVSHWSGYSHGRYSKTEDIGHMVRCLA